MGVFIARGLLFVGRGDDLDGGRIKGAKNDDRYIQVIF